MLERITLHAVVNRSANRQIHAICGTAEEAEKARKELHAMNADFPGDR